MKESKGPAPPAEVGVVKRERPNKQHIKKLKTRMTGNTVYSIGFRSGHKDEEEKIEGEPRPPPWAGVSVLFFN